ncbi:TIGR02588 family protein [Pararhizobium antarcticum]|uniref:TIGR02588 family protein n=1 Tax=Pararhizobium antarcticum TaxID=1798805 RepID=A0A657LWV5_9HYPH|nr:TIGR02588 family protein [Pararhizobium antarcticum]OJF97252.1 hypothetical protein AX761_15190 [Rhizobium sp. 58]OJF99076.1 hypothetical protein AX760_13950 [Pararhizobium antarcticum]
MDAKDSASRTRQTLDRKAHWIEWLLGGSCALLVAAMIGWIGYEALTGREGQAELSTRIVHQDKGDAGYRVMFLVGNTGKRTASSVVVRGEIRDGDSVLETSEVTFDYVPAHSSVSGTLLFRSPPQAGQLQVRPTAYSDP